MPVTEFAILEARAPYTVDSPIIQTFLQKVAQRQAAWSGYPLLFFRDSKTPAIIFLISGWKNIPAHQEWIASDGNQDFLREMQDILEVRAFHHLEINFETIPSNVSCLTWQTLPYDHAESEGRPALGSGIDGIMSKAVWEGSGRVLDGDEEGWHKLRAYITSTEEGAAAGGRLDGHQSVAMDGVLGTQGPNLVVTMFRLTFP